MRAKGYKESGMTEHEACKILGVSPEAGQEAIKKRYRELMRRVHPDAGGSRRKRSARDAATCGPRRLTGRIPF